MTLKRRPAGAADHYPDKVGVAFLRGFEPQELGRVGTRDIISEYRLEMRHPDAHALVADLATS